MQPADAERVRARSVKTHINWGPLVALMTASNAVMTEWGAERESEGRDDDNERLNQQTDSELVGGRKEVKEGISPRTIWRWRDAGRKPQCTKGINSLINQIWQSDGMNG